MKKFTLSFLALLLASIAPSESAAGPVPETGLYWNPDTPGLGWYIEVQGSTLVMLSYAHDFETEAPLFYLASGQIVEIYGTEPGRRVSYTFDGTLYRFERGPCITCYRINWDTSAHAQAAGQVNLTFSGHNAVRMNITMSNGRSQNNVILQRFQFGRPFYYLPLIATDELVDQYLSDLQGDWLFVDKDADGDAVRRFTFTEAEFPVEFKGSIFGTSFDGAESVVFRDPARDASLACVFFACSLRQGGTTLASFLFGDIAPDSMFGYKPTSDPEAAYYTGDKVIGLRIPGPESRDSHARRGAVSIADGMHDVCGGVDAGGCVGHHVLRAGGLAENDEIADGFGAGHKGSYAVDAEGDAAMRSAIGRVSTRHEHCVSG